MKKLILPKIVFITSLLAFVSFFGYLLFNISSGRAYENGYGVGYAKRDEELNKKLFGGSISSSSTNSPKSYFEALNKYRENKELPPIKEDQSFCNYARERAEEVSKDWSHIGYREDANSGYLYGTVCPECKRTGENLARDIKSPTDLIYRWDNSVVHREIMVGEFSIGCLRTYFDAYGEEFIALEVGR